MSRVVFVPQARDDLAGLFAFFADVRPSAAPRFLAAANRTAALLADFPEMGDPLDSPRPALAGIRRMRIRRFKKYVILYRPIADGVELLRVVHGARDMARIVDDVF